MRIILEAHFWALESGYDSIAELLVLIKSFFLFLNNIEVLLNYDGISSVVFLDVICQNSFAASNLDVTLDVGGRKT